MKLALIFLLSFVSVYSYHQLPHRSYYYDPRLFFYYPNVFGFPYYNSPMQQNFYDENGSAHQPEAKQIFQNIFRPQPSTTTTYTTSTVYTAVTIAQFKSCIGSLQFITNAGVTSTALCSRRRREAELVDGLVEVTPVLPLETTTVAAMDNTFDASGSQEAVELSSSLNGPIEHNFQSRFFNLPVVVTNTQTLYSTSTTFFSTTVTKSFTLASSVAPGPGLLCLPAGYTVC